MVCGRYKRLARASTMYDGWTAAGTRVSLGQVQGLVWSRYRRWAGTGTGVWLGWR